MVAAAGQARRALCRLISGAPGAVCCPNCAAKWVAGPSGAAWPTGKLVGRRPAGRARPHDKRARTRPTRMMSWRSGWAYWKLIDERRPGSAQWGRLSNCAPGWPLSMGIDESRAHKAGRLLLAGRPSSIVACLPLGRPTFIQARPPPPPLSGGREMKSARRRDFPRGPPSWSRPVAPGSGALIPIWLQPASRVAG